MTDWSRFRPSLPPAAEHSRMDAVNFANDMYATLLFGNDLFAPDNDDDGFTADFGAELASEHYRLKLNKRLITEEKGVHTTNDGQVDRTDLDSAMVERKDVFFDRFERSLGVGADLVGNNGGAFIQNTWHVIGGQGRTLDGKGKDPMHPGSVLQSTYPAGHTLLPAVSARIALLPQDTPGYTYSGDVETRVGAVSYARAHGGLGVNYALAKDMLLSAGFSLGLGWYQFSDPSLTMNGRGGYVPGLRLSDDLSVSLKAHDVTLAFVEQVHADGSNNNTGTFSLAFPL
jgi:hypothetical protein